MMEQPENLGGQELASIGEVWKKLFGGKGKKEKIIEEVKKEEPVQPSKPVEFPLKAYRTFGEYMEAEGLAKIREQFDKKLEKETATIKAFDEYMRAEGLAKIKERLHKKEEQNAATGALSRTVIEWLLAHRNDEATEPSKQHIAEAEMDLKDFEVKYGQKYGKSEDPTDRMAYEMGVKSRQKRIDFLKGNP